ncbi:MAG: hypothetical protein WCG62_07385 [Actinomycetes bacterium]
MMHARDADLVTVKVPFAVRKRGGLKMVLAPNGAPMPPTAPHVDSTLVKAIARAFQRQKMLDTARFVTIKEIAGTENQSLLCRPGAAVNATRTTHRPSDT